MKNATSQAVDFSPPNSKLWRMVKNAAEAMANAVRIQAMYLHQCGMWRLFLGTCSLGSSLPAYCHPLAFKLLLLLLLLELKPESDWEARRGFGFDFTNINVIKIIGGNTMKLLIRLTYISCVVKEIGPTVIPLVAPFSES